MQPRLFALDLPIVGLAYEDCLISPSEQSRLLAHLDKLDLTPFRFQQWEAKRLTRSFGWHFDFASGRLKRGDPLPDWLLPLRDRAAAFAGLAPEAFEHALVARYDPGSGIGWHRDRPAFGDVVGVSLDSPATLRFRKRTEDGAFTRFSLQVDPGSAYLLSGAAREEWEHRIVPGDARRFSVTFRTLIAKSP